jgi:hypothetical protein
MVPMGDAAQGSVCAARSAWWSISRCTQSACPCSAARCSAVSPPLAVLFTKLQQMVVCQQRVESRVLIGSTGRDDGAHRSPETTAASSSLTHLTWPPAAAACSAVRLLMLSTFDTFSSDTNSASRFICLFPIEQERGKNRFPKDQSHRHARESDGLTEKK